MKLRSSSPYPSRMTAARGFTLIELMITVGIVAILTAIAYPAYRNYVLRGQVANATQGLATTAANMERYFQDNRSYAPINSLTPPCSTSATFGTFTVSCTTAPTTTAYRISAVGINPGSTAGFTYTIDQNATQTTTIVAPAPSAWIISCPATWSTKAGQC